MFRRKALDVLRRLDGMASETREETLVSIDRQARTHSYLLVLV